MIPSLIGPPILNIGLFSGLIVYLNFPNSPPIPRAVLKAVENGLGVAPGIGAGDANPANCPKPPPYC
jgi:hypothetical protein